MAAAVWYSTSLHLFLILILIILIIQISISSSLFGLLSLVFSGFYKRKKKKTKKKHPFMVIFFSIFPITIPTPSTLFSVQSSIINPYEIKSHNVGRWFFARDRAEAMEKLADRASNP